jgi:uncharacterized membrane protein
MHKKFCLTNLAPVLQMLIHVKLNVHRHRGILFISFIFHYILLYLCFLLIFGSVNELLKAKEELTHERDEKLKEITGLREKIAETQEKEQKMESEHEEALSKIQEVFIRRDKN